MKILRALPSNTHKGLVQHFAPQSCPLDRWHFFAITTLTHRKPHSYAVFVKVFSLAFFKKQVGLSTPFEKSSVPSSFFQVDRRQIKSACDQRASNVLFSSDGQSSSWGFHLGNPSVLKNRFFDSLKQKSRRFCFFVLPFLKYFLGKREAIKNSTKP